MFSVLECEALLGSMCSKLQSLVLLSIGCAVSSKFELEGPGTLGVQDSALKVVYLPVMIENIQVASAIMQCFQSV